MGDLGTMLWKEWAEFIGNRRSLRVFGIAVLVMGIVPTLSFSKGLPDSVEFLILFFYVLFAAMITTAQIGTDLVLHERSTKTLEPLLATRLPDGVIFGGKVLAAVLFGYLSALLTVVVQTAALNITGKVSGLVGLSTPVQRLLLLGTPVVLAAYLATVAVFVGLRVADQRSAYLLTMVSLAVLGLPFVLHLVHPHLTLSWVAQALLVMAIVDALLIRIGIRLFRRERLVLYLQD